MGTRAARQRSGPVCPGPFVPHCEGSSVMLGWEGQAGAPFPEVLLQGMPLALELWQWPAQPPSAALLCFQDKVGRPQASPVCPLVFFPALSRHLRGTDCSQLSQSARLHPEVSVFIFSPWTFVLPSLLWICFFRFQFTSPSIRGSHSGDNSGGAGP